MRRFALVYLFLSLAVVLPSCTREPQPGKGEDAPVLLATGTKALPAGIETFRALMFSTNSRQYTGRSGSYCTLTFSHTDDYTDPLNPVTYRWLQPCRVSEAGAPLDINGDPVSSLADADHGSSYGLRWNGTSNGSGNGSMVAVAPAVDFVMNDAVPGPPDRLVWQNLGHAVWLNWTLGTEIYISDPVAAGFSGIWFDGQYSYSSSTSELSTTLVDHRAKVTIKIQCSTDLIPQTHLYDVRVTDRIVTDRFYLLESGDNVRGFSRPTDPEDASIIQYFIIDSDPAHALPLMNGAGLPDWTDPANKNVLLEKDVTDWTSSDPFYLQARDYSAVLMTGKRPVIEVRLGTDPTNPVRVRVPLAQELLPMHHYVYTLDVTNAYVSIYRSVIGWDEVMTGSNEDGGKTIPETPAYLGTVAVGGPGAGDDAWGAGGGGTADKPVTP